MSVTKDAYNAAIAIAKLAIKENPERFKSNTAHAKFAASVADLFIGFNAFGDFNRAEFIRGAMPKHLVGTSGENAWERVI